MKPLTVDAARVAAAEQDEDALVLAAQRSPRAFDPLYSRYVDRVYRYLYSRLGSRQDAQDLTSQVFLAALEGLPRYRPQGHFAAWLFSIARHKAADHFRRRGSEIPLDPALEMAAADDDPATGALRAEARQALRAQIGRLTADEQELLRLRFVSELSFAEMARLLGGKEEAVKKRVYRLLARLEDQLEASHD